MGWGARWLIDDAFLLLPRADVPLGELGGGLEEEDGVDVVGHLAVFVVPVAEGVVGVFTGGFFFGELDGGQAGAVGGGGAAGSER